MECGASRIPEVTLQPVYRQRLHTVPKCGHFLLETIMFTTQDAITQDLSRANMCPHPMCEVEPFHFSAEFRDVALRHVWTLNQAAIAAEVRERGMPRRI